MVIIKQNTQSASNNQQYIQGRGYVDGSGFIDSFKSIGNYISQNKDLILKPVISGISNLAVTGLSEGSRLLLSKINNNKKSEDLSAQSKKLLNDMVEGNVHPATPVTNMIGSGIKRF